MVPQGIEAGINTKPDERRIALVERLVECVECGVRTTLRQPEIPKIPGAYTELLAGQVALERRGNVSLRNGRSPRSARFVTMRHRQTATMPRGRKDP